ncbi:DNA replication regulator SLD3-domain-containing protein [Bombardia bombarda]|uniref:DNA replication regulator SLD3-domain-containing protein n=1 Tax=Bombardia bombarda TaxID=252184 RepID=A0AA39WN99_9PEZI|nr:DNA replication regulator SLD3-domain-containing protein [Bombardia bombarda]
MSSSARRDSGASVSRPASAVSLSRPSSARASFPSLDSRHDSQHDSELSDSKKRKRDSTTPLAADDLLKAPVVLKPHPASLAVKPRILHLLMLLPREHVPLSALDLAQPHGDFPACRFFESHIKILDLEGRLGSNVLLARSDTSRMVYAIEREGHGLYVLCKLGAWVDIEKLAQCATVVCNQRIKTCRPSKPTNSAFPSPIITPQMHKENKKRRLAIEVIQSMVRKRSSTIPDKESQPQSRPQTPSEKTAMSEKPVGRNIEPADEVADNSMPPPAGKLVSGSSSALVDDPLVQPSAEAIFENIRVQYFEALYHSMGSLAYFAKGPLSRARAAFHLDCDSSLEMNDLIDFLRSLVMTTVLIDKKYRETIPDIMAKMKTHVEDSDNGESKSKKKKPKKLKLGRDGLYLLEDRHVRRWWTAHKPASFDDDGKMVVQTETRYHVSCLRRRETQLQMILILEILALEPLRRPADAAEESQLPGLESYALAREAAQEASTKKRNKTNLPVLLDVHADRLCIWQTTTSDEVKSLAESQTDPHSQDPQRAERVNSDPLRDFCVDIIVPFFSARLPELCDSINRKLGGPVAQAPSKEKHSKPTVLSRPKPGAPAKRALSSRNDKEKNLERVLSNERMRRSVSRGPSGAIALMRSASATTIPGLKREGSEPFLAMIPKVEKSSLKDRPINVFSQSTGSIVTQNVKATKKALVEAELKEAISALKRPNRALAGKELVEAAEKRTTFVGATPQKKLNKKPNRVASVQVKATPANNRFKDVLGTESQLAKLDQLAEEATEFPPSASSVVLASSAPRSRFSNIFTASSATMRSQQNKVQATPTRMSSLPTPTFQVPQENLNFPPSSPVVSRKAAFISSGQNLSVPASDGSSKGSSRLDMLPSSPGLTGLFETPVNARSSRDNRMMLNDTPIRSRLSTVEDGVKRYEKGFAGKIGGTGGGDRGKEDVSIYHRLGWDTGDFDELDDLA